MSGARRRSKSSWDNKEEAIPQTEKIPWHGKDLDSSFHQNTSPKHSNSEANDILMYDDFSMQQNENIPYRGDNNRGPRNRDRSRSPHRNRDRERRESRFRDDRNRDSDVYRKDEGDYNNHRGNYNDRSNNAYDDQDHRRSSSQNVKPPCRFFMRGDCNRNRCKFSHDVQKSEGIEGNSHDHDDYNNNRLQPLDHVIKSERNLDEKNKSWNDLESGSFHNNIGNQDFSQNMSLTFNGDEKSLDMNGSNDVLMRMEIKKERDNIMNNESGNVLEGSRNDIPNEAVSFPKKKDVFLRMDIKKETENIHSESGKLLEGSRNYISNEAVSFPEKKDVFLRMDIKKETDNIHNESGKLLEGSRNDIPNETVSFPEKQILANALELLYSLPNSASSEPVKTSVVNTGIVDSGEERNQKPVELVEVKKEEKSKNVKLEKIEGQGKVEEGDEKAMRQFKNALVEFVKEILKPTWKEGKMSREVYKTIVKKVVEKVSSSIQGVQIPKTQEKIDQYLAFSKSKITKLVEAYVGRLQKA